MLATRNESLDANYANGEAKMVEPAEFEKLLISYGSFERFFDSCNNVWGLRERETGNEYLVYANDLYQWQLAR
jgi:hypothetical protein